MAEADQVAHVPGRAQQWPDVDPDISAWVSAVVATLAGTLGDRVVGVVLHGSLAMGSYYRPKSDIDLLVVVDVALSDVVRRSLADGLLARFDERPTLGGLELSVITAASAGRFTHPLPYEFHFSEKWAEQIRCGGHGPVGEDPDLAAHCTAARQRGTTLTGPPAVQLIGPVPTEAFRAAVMDDLAWIVQEDGIHESPFYGILNSCRALHLLAEGSGEVLSKEEGALWGIDHLPDQHRVLIDQALACYRSDAPVPNDQRRTHGHDWDHEPLEHFKRYVDRHAFGGREATRLGTDGS